MRELSKSANEVIVLDFKSKDKRIIKLDAISKNGKLWITARSIRKALNTTHSIYVYHRRFTEGLDTIKKWHMHSDTRHICNTRFYSMEATLKIAQSKNSIEGQELVEFLKGFLKRNPQKNYYFTEDVLQSLCQTVDDIIVSYEKISSTEMLARFEEFMEKQYTGNLIKDFKEFAEFRNQIKTLVFKIGVELPYVVQCELKPQLTEKTTAITNFS